MKKLIKEATGYLAASAIALAVDMGILWVLVDFFSCEYLTAATASFLAGATVAYVLSLKLAFKQHRLQDQRAEFFGFVAIGALGLIVNTGIMFLAVKYFGLQYLLAKCVAACFTFVCNFIARRQVLFSSSSPA